jgi:HAD superfamily hydrolase (TIGR01509 family)
MNLTSPPSLLPAAVLFDMDGLLVETEHLWYAAELDVVAEIGGDWGPQHQEALLGGPLEKAVELLVAQAGGVHDRDKVMALLLTSMERQLRTQPVHWRPGAQSLLGALEDAGVPCALVSASWRSIVDAVHDAVLHEVGHDVFATTVAGDEVERTKPYPDPYLLAAARIGVPVDQCVILEDSHTGLRAGLASGAYVVAVPSLVDIEPEPGMRVVATLEGLTPALLGEWSHAWSDRPQP